MADTLFDLSKYSPKLADSSVVAYPVKKTKARRREGRRDMEFTIKAQFVKAKPGVVIDEPVEEVKEETKKEETEKEEVKKEEVKKEEVKEEAKKDEPPKEATKEDKKDEL